MRVPIDEFEGQEIERIYLASTLVEAQRIEEVLNASPFHYATEIEEYRGAITGAFGPTGVGVAFLVSPRHSNSCKQLLIEKGLTTGIEEGQCGG